MQDSNFANDLIYRNAHSGVYENMLIFTSVLGLAIAIALFFIGKKGKQLYLQVWSAGLFILSILHLGYLVAY